MILYIDGEEPRVYQESLQDMLKMMEFINLESLSAIEEFSEATQYRFFM